MAPEQAEGRGEEIDARSDIFALGGILYNILTLHPPVLGSSVAEIVQKVRTGNIAHPSTFNQANIKRRKHAAADRSEGMVAGHYSGRGIVESLSAVAMKAMQLLSEERYQTVTEMQRDIEAYQNGFATVAEQASTWKQLTLLIKRHKVEAAGLILIVILAAGFMVKIVASERRARITLTRLLATAPTSYDQARSLVQEQKFPEAFEKISAAIALTPQQKDYHFLKGNIFQSLLRLSDARDAYAEELRWNPKHELASANLKLCERILAANQGRKDLLPTSVADLQAAMLKQERYAEAVAMLGSFARDKQKLNETWQAVLSKAGFGGRLTMDESGLFMLDLTGAPVHDLSLIKGLPVRSLNLTGTKVSDLGPLRGMELVHLELESCPVSDLSALKGMALEHLNISGTQVSDLGALKGMPLQKLNVIGTSVKDLGPLSGMGLTELTIARNQVSDLTPLKGMPLHYLTLCGTQVSDLSPLRSMALTYLQLHECEELHDLSPLVDCKQLQYLSLPPHCNDLECLRNLPNLKYLGPDATTWAGPPTAAEFWKAYDAKKGERQ